MATISTLVAEGKLLQIEVELDVREQAWRCIYGTPQFIQELQRFLNEAEPSPIGADEALDEQLDALLHAFIVGDELHFDRQFHILNPNENGIWELKTPDLRIFGWFSHRDHFVAASLRYADQCKGTGKWQQFGPMYKWFRKEAEDLRSALGCVQACVWSKEASDVLSVRD